MTRGQTKIKSRSKIRRTYILKIVCLCSEMLNTAVTDNDWVCSKMKRATDLFTLGAVGLIVGTFFFSAIADWKGRKPSFFFSTAFMIIFSIVSIFISDNYIAYIVVKVIFENVMYDLYETVRNIFFFLQVLAFAAMLPLFQSPMNIITEISTMDSRAFVIGFACITWSLGNCVMPFVAWLIPRCVYTFSPTFWTRSIDH